MVDALRDLTCVPCRKGTPPLDDSEIAELLPQVPSWELVDDGGVRKLRRRFSFDDFARAFELAQRVGAAAEEQGHHPVLEMGWGRTTVTWWTHAIGGLHRNDFVMAAKTDALAEERSRPRESSVPILPGRDLRETLAFYERLGFENRGAPPDEWNYLIIGRGDVWLHFIGMSDVDPLTTAAGCFVYVADADALHDEWQRLGVPTDPATGSRLVPPMDTDYGMREFALVDPSGNLVRVGSPLRR